MKPMKLGTLPSTTPFTKYPGPFIQKAVEKGGRFDLILNDDDLGIPYFKGDSEPEEHSQQNDGERISRASQKQANKGPKETPKLIKTTNSQLDGLINNLLQIEDQKHLLTQTLYENPNYEDFVGT